MGQKKSFLCWVVLLVLGLALILFFATHYLFDPALYQEALKKILSDHLKREVTFEKAKLKLWGGFGAVFEDFRIKDTSLSFDLLRTKRVILNFNLLPLLRKEIKWKSIVLDQPVCRIVKSKQGIFNFFDLPLQKEDLSMAQRKILQTLTTLFGGSLTLQEGEISFVDENLNEENPFLIIQSLYLQFSKVSFQKPFPFQVRGKILHGGREGRFSISGTIGNIPEEMVFSNVNIEAKIELQDIEVLHFWPYLKKILPQEKIGGLLNLKGHYQGTLSGPFKGKGKIRFKEVTYEDPKVFAFSFHPRWIHIDFITEYDKVNFKVPQFMIELPEIRVKGKGRIYGIGTKDMGLEVEAQSSTFEISEGKKFIPFKIITSRVSNPLFRGEGKGLAQILSVRLSGKIPEIDQCDQLKNAHVLSIEMRVQKAWIKLPWDLPPLEGLKAHLTFKEGHLIIKEATGRFLHSQINKAKGTFFELLHTPILEMNWEGRFDLNDLLPLLNSETFSGEFPKEFYSISSLSGKSTYRIYFKGRLKHPLSFEHQGHYQLLDVRLTHPKIPFPVLLGKGYVDLSHHGLRWYETKIVFGNSYLFTEGSLRGKKFLEVVSSGSVDLKNIFHLSQSPLFPQETRLKGKVFERFAGTGNISLKLKAIIPQDSFSYEIHFQPKETSFFLSKSLPPLLFKEGGISLSPSRITFSKLKLLYANDSFALNGTIEENHLDLTTSGQIDLKNLKTLLQFPLLPESLRHSLDEFKEISGPVQGQLQWMGEKGGGVQSIQEGVIRFKGASFHHSRFPLPILNTEGTLLLTPNQFRIVELKATLGEFPFTLSWSSSRLLRTQGKDQKELPNKEVTFTFLSPRLDLDLLFPKKEGRESFSLLRLRDWLSHWDIHGVIGIEEGRFQNLLFRDLKIEMKTTERRLFINPFQFQSDGGNISASGWIEPSPKGIRFELHPCIFDLEVQEFLRTILGKKERNLLTGRLKIEPSDLKGEGDDFQKIKESLNGTLKLTLEKGVIERGNVLAKIFSILNVSQLFKGRLPDLKTKGLPYQWITATIRIREGVVSTEDLLVESDAMRITVIGKVDLGKNLIEARIGIHPLITMDTLLSHIPLAGYILTGKDRSFISYFYEVKGEIDHPTIEAIPLKSFGEGFLGMVKRLLETPLKPFKRSKTNKEK
ncbi:MAG: YhdP family protein [Thermodesulfobacteriota bacterium]